MPKASFRAEISGSHFEHRKGVAMLIQLAFPHNRIRTGTLCSGDKFLSAITKKVIGKWNPPSGPARRCGGAAGRPPSARAEWGQPRGASGAGRGKCGDDSRSGAGAPLTAMLIKALPQGCKCRACISTWSHPGPIPLCKLTSGFGRLPICSVDHQFCLSPPNQQANRFKSMPFNSTGRPFKGSLIKKLLLW